MKCRYCGSKEVYEYKPKRGERPVSQKLMHKIWCPRKLEVLAANEVPDE